uniref:BTB domain-containing protein n=1 Tax=Plectus sambesii TaxID=2011161 RepID=A0A914UMP1_9BILA
MDADNRIVLNIGGTRHETYIHVLKKIPATRLSRLSPTLGNYDPVLNEYFFDRHPEAFEMILNYYRTGKLHYPTNVCGPLFEEELEYWGLDSNQVEPCCWMTYTLFRDTQDTLQIINGMKLDSRVEKLTEEEVAQQFGWENDYYDGNLSWWQKHKPKLWAVFNDPRSSHIAKAISIISTILVLLSITAFAARTVPLAEIPSIILVEEWNASMIFGVPGSYSPVITPFQVSMSYQSFTFYTEMICNVWFAFELVGQLLFCPKLGRFLKSPLTIIDIIAIISFVLDSVVKVLVANDVIKFFDAQASKEVLELFAIVRILRLFKLAQHYTAFKVLAQTFKASSRVLALILFFVILFVVLLASFIYCAERIMYNPNNRLTDAVQSLWWAIITLTTIGYGDYVPMTFSGKLVGSLAALASVLVVAFPVPVIVANFSNLYLHMRARAKLPKRRLRVLQAHELKPTVTAPTTLNPGHPTFRSILSRANNVVGVAE